MKNILVYMIKMFLLIQSLGASENKTSITQVAQSRGFVDTVGVGLENTGHIGLFPGDILLEIYQAPVDLTLYGVGVNIKSWNTDSQSSNLRVDVYRQGLNRYPFGALESYYPSSARGDNGWLGYAHPADNDTIAYPDTSTGQSLIWNNFNNGIGVCNSVGQMANSAPVLGTKVLPVSNDVIIQMSSDSSMGLYFADFTDMGGAQFQKDEYIAVAVTYLNNSAENLFTQDAEIRIYSSDTYSYPAPGLKYYAGNCSVLSGEHGWYIMDSTTSQFQYAVEYAGDIPPRIELINYVENENPWDEPKVFAFVEDFNPSTGYPCDEYPGCGEGIEIVGLHWQYNSTDSDSYAIAMSRLFNLLVQDYRYYRTIESAGQPSSTLVYWWVSAEDEQGNISRTQKQSYMVGTLETDNNVTPHDFDIIGNFPNPFNPSTSIVYSVDVFADLAIAIYNIRGQMIRDLYNGATGPGQHSVQWDGKDQFGLMVPSGIYFYKLESDGQSLFAKLMLLK